MRALLPDMAPLLSPSLGCMFRMLGAGVLSIVQTNSARIVVGKILPVSWSFCGQRNRTIRLLLMLCEVDDVWEYLHRDT